MAVYHVNGPNGEVYEVTAPDNATQAQVVAFAQQHAQATQAPKSGGILNDIGSAVSGAASKLKTDVANDYQATIREAKTPSANPLAGLGRTGQVVGDAVNLLASPVAGLVHGAVVKPVAAAMDQIPAQAYAPPQLTRNGLAPARPLNAQETHAANEQSVNTALMGARPGAAPVPVTIASKPNAFANMAQRFDAAGVTPLPVAAGGKGAATLTNVVAENPLAGGAVRNRLRTAVTQTSDSAQNLASRYGDARGPQITGENVQAGVQDFARNKANPTSFASKSEQLYDRAFTPINIAEQQAVERAGQDFSARNAQADATHAANVQAHAAATEQAQRAADSSNALTRHLGQETTPTSIPAPERPEVSPQRPVVTPSATITTLKQLDSRVNAPSLSNLITDGRVRSIMHALSNDAPDVRFNDLRQLRTWVRNAQGNPELRQGITSAGLQQLEQSLTTDIYNNAARLGGQSALHALQRADDYYRAGSSRIKGALQPFADAKSGEGAYSRIVQAAGSTAAADAQRLLSLKRSLHPDQWGDVAANVVSEMGKQTAGAAPAGENGFSVNTFVTNYNKLSPRGKDVLFGSVGGGGQRASELRAALDNLASVADDLKRVEKGANTSKSFVNAQAAGTLTGLLAPVSREATIAGLSGMALTGEAMTNPVVVRWLTRLGRASKAGNPGAVQVVVKQIGSAARTNAALAPLYQESMKLLAPPSQLLTKSSAEQQQPPPGP